MPADINQTVSFLDAAIMEIAGFSRPHLARLLDFGCGTGQLVEVLCRRGFEAYGCDITSYWSAAPPSLEERLRTISLSPYRLPFDASSFDIVVSTSVLEHVQNKAEAFCEIHRVLRPGGYAMHLYPGKWYLPYEPHIRVPLANYLWPHCPRWWLVLWARLGVRNEFQQNQPWQSVASANHHYCQESLSYWSTQHYRDLSMKVFGNCLWPMRFYVDHAPGGFAQAARSMPFKAVLGALSRETRMAFLVQRKVT